MIYCYENVIEFYVYEIEYVEDFENIFDVNNLSLVV